MVFTDGPYAKPKQAGIHPDYDFMEVRENADMVLYMPCYKDESQAAEDHCQIPQALYSDIIIVPSKSVNEVYVNAMSRLENGRNMAKRIYVLDAPDSDKVLSDVLKKKGKESNR